MKRGILSLAVGMLALAPLGSSRAGVIYNAQVRTVSAEVTAATVSGQSMTDSENFAAPDFQLFSETATASASVTSPSNHVSGSASSSQTSTLDAFGFSATSSITAQMSASDFTTAAGNSESISHFEVRFVTDSPMQLGGNLRGGASPLGRNARVSLVSSGNTVAEWTSQGSLTNISFAVAPGVYTLVAEIENRCSPFMVPITMSYNLTLTPEPASAVLMALGVWLMRSVRGRRG